MTKQDFTVYTYKTDKRTKSKEKLVGTRVIKDMDEQTLKAIVVVALEMNPGFRFEYFPTMKTVTNLMSGVDIQIPHDTPWSCNPASETYWSM